MKKLLIIIAAMLGLTTHAFAFYEKENNLLSDAPYISISKHEANAAEGAWQNQVSGPNIFYRNSYYYTGSINPIGPVMDYPSPEITSVSWQWSIFNSPSEVNVFLCANDISHCYNVTKFGTGATSIFNKLSAKSAFFFAFFVPGSGYISPTPVSQINSVTVSYK